MRTKLTLRLDSHLIEEAKDFAGKKGKSLSQVVADYFTALLAQDNAKTSPDSTADPLTSLVSKLKGALAGSGIDEEDYYTYLEEKYLRQ